MSLHRPTGDSISIVHRLGRLLRAVHRPPHKEQQRLDLVGRSHGSWRIAIGHQSHEDDGLAERVEGHYAQVPVVFLERHAGQKHVSHLDRGQQSCGFQLEIICELHARQDTQHAYEQK